MLIYEILQYFLLTIAGALISYQFVLSLFALKGKEITHFDAEKQRRFIIVIPAYNEEEVITKILYSLFGLIYPANLFDIVVVADNCTDKTAKIAQSLGAKVLERNNKEQRGKGYALAWAFEQIHNWDEQYDAYVVLDADSLISGNFLEVVNYYIEQGSEVIQSSDLVIPRPGVWSSEAIRIGFLLYNYVKPMGRKVLGYDVGLRGNGMCFAEHILREHPWRAWSLTEDLEYGLHLMLQNIRISFAPEAHIWAQMPGQAKNAETQRRRWEMGRYAVVRKYAPKFLKSFFTKGNFRHLDTFFELITPPLVNLLLVIVLLFLFNLILWLAGVDTFAFMALWLMLAGIGILHFLIGLAAAKADRQLYKSMLYIPVYVFWKIKIYTLAFLKGWNKQWIRTTREK